MITEEILKELDLIGKVRSNIEYEECTEEEKKLFCDKCIEKKVTFLTNKKTRVSELVDDEDIGYPTAKSMLEQGLIPGIQTKTFSDMTEEEQKIFTDFKENWWNDNDDEIGKED